MRAWPTSRAMAQRATAQRATAQRSTAEPTGRDLTPRSPTVLQRRAPAATGESPTEVLSARREARSAPPTGACKTASPAHGPRRSAARTPFVRWVSARERAHPIRRSVRGTAFNAAIRRDTGEHPVPASARHAWAARARAYASQAIRAARTAARRRAERMAHGTLPHCAALTRLAAAEGSHRPAARARRPRVPVRARFAPIRWTSRVARRTGKAAGIRRRRRHAATARVSAPPEAHPAARTRVPRARPNAAARDCRHANRRATAVRRTTPGPLAERTRHAPGLQEAGNVPVWPTRPAPRQATCARGRRWRPARRTRRVASTR